MLNIMMLYFNLIYSFLFCFNFLLLLLVLDTLWSAMTTDLVR